MSYSKLHSSIVNSSLWTEPDDVRILFITLLAACDRDGIVYGSRGGLERLANIEIDPEENPWTALLSPDPDSSDLMRNPENEGRRIEEVPGGFKLLNFNYYRGLRNDDDRREQNRIAQQRFKEKAKVSQDKPQSAGVSRIASVSVSVSESEKKEGIGEKEEPTPEDIFQAYPLKKAKPEAIKAIRKALKTKSAVFLLERTKAYAATRNGDLAYVPNPSTWFNQERFNDEPSTWKRDNGVKSDRYVSKAKTLPVDNRSEEEVARTAQAVKQQAEEFRKQLK